MKKISTLLFLFTLICYYSCSIDSDIEDDLISFQKARVIDSLRINHLKQLIVMRNQLDSVVTDNVAYNCQVGQLKVSIDSLMNIELDLKENIINTEYLKVKVSEIQSIKTKIKIVNDSLLINNGDLSKQIEFERLQKNLAIAEGYVLKEKVKKASELQLTGLYVSGVAYTYSLFSKPKEYLTNYQNKIKKIKVSFSFPDNELAVKEEKNIHIVAYGVDQREIVTKDTLIDYQGIESKISLYLLTPNINIGVHRIYVFVNNKEKGQINLIVK